MSESSPTPNPSPLPHGGELSPVAQACAQWFRHLARAVKSARLYRCENPIVEGLREQTWDQLSEVLKQFGALRFKVTSEAFKLEDEVVIKGPKHTVEFEEQVVAPEQKLPFLFYRDGIRGFALLPKLQKREYDQFFDALVQIGKGRNTQDDLMTLLWQANLGAMQIDSVPPEQTIFLSSRRPVNDGARYRGQSFAWGASGAEIRGDIGQLHGGQGLHRDTFDDWRLPDVHVLPLQAYEALMPQVKTSRDRFLRAWEAERSEDWSEQAIRVVRQMIGAEDNQDMREALSHALVRWIAAALQRAAWSEAERALGLLRTIDPDGARTEAGLSEALEGIEGEVVAAQLDESDPEEQARFAALALSIGKPAIELVCAVMSLCERARPRAAATTALCYLCGDQPGLLARCLEDERWYVVRNAVFVLGQIGGPEVVPLLRDAAGHHEPRVRREVERALGNVPRAERTPILVQQLASRDPQLLSATLHLLIRERHPRVIRVILDRIEARDFDYLPEGLQRAFINALAEIADDEAVPSLERLLLRDDGWFAMRTLSRDAAARILCRLGTERAMAVIDAGLRSKTEAVRIACLTAMENSRKAA